MAARHKGSADRVAVQNAAKTLAANIRFASVDGPVSSIVVTSSIPGEGKTFVSHALARALAAGGRRTLLVECDMRKRSLSAVLGVHPRYGIYSVLSGDADLSEAVSATSSSNLFFLDAEPHIPNPTEILSSKRFRGLLGGLRRDFAYVVLDTPPLGAFVDAAVLGSMVDATLLVVRENFVRREDLVASYTQLKQADANVIGTVLNCCEPEGGGYYGYYSSDDGDGTRAPGTAPGTASSTTSGTAAAGVMRPVGYTPEVRR